jgi:hypothetical protein
MKTKIFTFGQGQSHEYMGTRVDKDTIIKMTAENPRKAMFDIFGSEWAFEYEEKQLDDITKYYPHGFDLVKITVISDEKIHKINMEE